MDNYDFSLTGAKKCGGGGSRKNNSITNKSKKNKKQDISVYSTKHVRKLEALMEKKQQINKST